MVLVNNFCFIHATFSWPCRHFLVMLLLCPIMNQCDAQLALLRSQIGLISRTEKSTVTPPKDFISKVEGGYFVNFVRDESVGLPIECHTERTRISCSSSLSVQKFPREIFVLFFYWATNSISVATIYFHKFFFSFCGTYFFLAPVRKR